LPTSTGAYRERIEVEENTHGTAEKLLTAANVLPHIQVTHLSVAAVRLKYLARKYGTYERKRIGILSPPRWNTFERHSRIPVEAGFSC